METEIKFALSPEARGNLERGVLADAAGHAVETDRTTYFDTPERTLKKAGFSLRIRDREGNDRIQTVKAAGRGAYQRQEWEWPVAGERPDCGRLREVPGLPDVGTDGSRLRPVFRTDVKRTLFTLTPSAGSKIELALDEGAIVADSRSEPLSELELELKDGAERTLLREGLRLLREAPLVLMSESKAERGYHLADGTPPAAHKPGRIALDAKLTVGKAFQSLADAVVDQLLVNQPAALRGDEREGVHQMRVAVRRLRSLLMLFDHCLEPHVSVQFEQELRRLGQVLGAARDWDVFLSDTLPQATKGMGDLEWIEPLRARAEQRQHAAHQAAKKALLEPGFGRFVLSFLAWSGNDGSLPPDLVKRPVRRAADGMLSRLARKVEKRIGDADFDDPDSLHSLRKSAKKLRYGIEFLHGLYGRKADAYLKRCNALQKKLGNVNDLVTLEGLANDLTADGHLDLAPALGLLANRSEALIAQEMHGAQKALRKFQREGAFWN